MRRKTSRRREASLDSCGDPRDGGDPWCEAIPSEAAALEELAIRAEELANRWRLLADLKPDQRRALALFGFGLSYAEICQATGWTYTKVNRSIAEGRAALREHAHAGG
jgi:DNA-directed RNA polymerase specialized sigma24 family protein